MSTRRIRKILARHGVTDLTERWGEIILCRWPTDTGQDHRWGHPGCGAYGFHTGPAEAVQGAREHLTGCELRRTAEDRRASPDALIYSLVRVDPHGGWQPIEIPDQATPPR